MSAVVLDDLSARPRVGCKGPAAEGWLASRGVTVPGGANRYSIDSSGVLSARLATSEFLLESVDEQSDNALTGVKHALSHADYPSGVYPVLRQDFVLEVSGLDVQQLFLQTCAVDLAPVAAASGVDAGPLIMTSMIGVSVVLTCRQVAAGPRFTVWSDPSYSSYFWTQLLAIATGLGGGAHSESSIRRGGNNS
jgi:sarcosine oxidase gamma subunit